MNTLKSLCCHQGNKPGHRDPILLPLAIASLCIYPLTILAILTIIEICPIASLLKKSPPHLRPWDSRHDLTSFGFSYRPIQKGYPPAKSNGNLALQGPPCPITSTSSVRWVLSRLKRTVSGFGIASSPIPSGI